MDKKEDRKIVRILAIIPIIAAILSAVVLAAGVGSKTLFFTLNAIAVFGLIFGPSIMKWGEKVLGILDICAGLYVFLFYAVAIIAFGL